jgi:fructose-specific component phosphotransferase system IIB-like protein
MKAIIANIISKENERQMLLIQNDNIVDATVDGKELFVIDTEHLLDICREILDTFHVDKEKGVDL